MFKINIYVILITKEKWFLSIFFKRDSDELICFFFIKIFKL